MATDRNDSLHERVKVITLGCPKNTVDSEAMMGVLRARGYQLTENAEEADVLVVNTCAFIDAAKEESIDTILDVAQLKEADPSKRLVVAGCLAQRYAAELAESLPEVDAFVGTSEFLGLPDVVLRVRRRVEAGEPLLNVGSPIYRYTGPQPRQLTTPWHYAYLKIGEGCDHRCTFCAIPSFRGPFVSRPIETLVHEAATLAASGVKELVLISQDTTWYGRDLDGKSRLPELLRRLCRIDGIEWIRLLYLYPTLVDEALLDAIAEEAKVCAYLDVPLQHIDDGVLRRMGRGMSEAFVREFIGRVRDRIPDVTLRTTFIVGFPGETDEAFEKLLNFVIESRFEHCGVFPYSAEDGTPSATWDDQVNADVAEARLMELVAAQAEVARVHRATYCGQRVTVLVDGKKPGEPYVEARMRSQAPEIDDVVYLKNADVKSGTFVRAKVVDTLDLDLLAEPV